MVFPNKGQKQPKGVHVNQSFTINKTQREKKQPKIIKRYSNRKLYDTEQSSYVVLNDIAKMIRNNEEIRVIDNETKDDITNSTLTQIIFGAEKKSSCAAPLDILKNIIMTGDGSLSNFLAARGFFVPSEAKKETTLQRSSLENSQVQPEKPTLEERIVNAASSSIHEIEETELPKLPISNKNL